MTLEIIIFISALLLGIVLYWRESKSNAIYRFINRLTHNEELQMKDGNLKGFFHQQAFLMRLVYVTLLYVLAAVVVRFVTPINAFFVQYFASAIVGTLIGTYIASAFLFARDSTSKKNLETIFEKGKTAMGELADDVKESFESKEQAAPEANTTKTETEGTKKSARDRLKDKGMIN